MSKKRLLKHWCDLSKESIVHIVTDDLQYPVAKAIENTSWNKNYMLSAKGSASLRLACVTPREYSVITSKNAQDIHDFLSDIMFHIEHYEE